MYLELGTLAPRVAHDFIAGLVLNLKLLSVLLLGLGLIAEFAIADDELPSAEVSAGNAVQQWFDDAWHNAISPNVIQERLQLRVGAYLMADWGDVSQSSELDSLYPLPGSPVALRDLKLDIRGIGPNSGQFRFQFDINDGQPELQDVYLRKDLIRNWGSIQIGHFSEPFGLENTMSFQHIPLLERSLVETLAPSRGVGIAYENDWLDSRVSGRLGVFYETNSVDSISDSRAVALTGRVTGLPLYRNEGDELVHLGLSASLRDLNAPIEFTARPEVNQSPRYLDTGELSADRLTVANLEAAYKRGPHLFQWEYAWCVTSGALREEDITLGEVADTAAETYPRLIAFLQGQTGWERPEDSFLWQIPFDLSSRGELHFFGTYAQWSYVLTKEARPYDMKRGVFGPVVPRHPVRFHGERGWGAWEVAARISHLDLADGYAEGGRETNVSLGLNWYLDENVRVMWNYVHGDVSQAGIDSNFDAIQMRVHIGFQPALLDSFGGKRPAKGKST